MDQAITLASMATLPEKGSTCQVVFPPTTSVFLRARASLYNYFEL